MLRSGTLSAINTKRPHREWKARKVFPYMSKPRYCVFQAACEGTAIPTELCRTEVFSQLMSGKSDTRASTVWRKESCPLPRLITGEPPRPTTGKYSPAHSTRVKTTPLKDVTSSRAKLAATGKPEPQLPSSSTPSLLPDPAAAVRCWPQRGKAGQHLSS